MEVDLEKELKVRKRILAIYNKDREDFSSKNEYDDYLEEVEDIIWRLSANLELDRTEAQVRKYRQQNQEQINSKSARQANLDAHLDASQLAAASMAGTQAPKAAPPPSSGGVPTILPRLAQDYSALLEASRDIKYDNRLLGKSGPEAAAAGGWSAGVWHARFAQEAFSSLLLAPVR